MAQRAGSSAATKKVISLRWTVQREKEAHIMFHSFVGIGEILQILLLLCVWRLQEKLACMTKGKRTCAFIKFNGVGKEKPAGDSDRLSHIFLACFGNLL